MSGARKAIVSVTLVDRSIVKRTATIPPTWDDSQVEDYLYEFANSVAYESTSYGAADYEYHFAD